MKITDRKVPRPKRDSLEAEGDIYTPRCPCEGDYCTNPECDWPIVQTPGPLCEKAPTPGYHMHTITKGELGELSKIQEELDEVKDAAWQRVRIMELVELSDLIGAVCRYLERHHPGVTLDDLTRMSDVTRRAFESGHRKER